MRNSGVRPEVRCWAADGELSGLRESLAAQPPLLLRSYSDHVSISTTAMAGSSQSAMGAAGEGTSCYSASCGSQSDNLGGDRTARLRPWKHQRIGTRQLSLQAQDPYGDVLLAPEWYASLWTNQNPPFTSTAEGSEGHLKSRDSVTS
jgi:hypothetical protein